MKAAVRHQLDPTIRSTDTCDFHSSLRARLWAGRGCAVPRGHVSGVLRRIEFARPSVGNLLFLGPTGSGKTRIVEAAAEILFGDARAVIKVDCAEFQHSHEIAS